MNTEDDAPLGALEDKVVPDSPEEAGDELAAMLDALDSAREVVEQTARERPYLAAGAAMGIGYVLGGGLPRWMVRAVLAFAFRTLTGIVVRHLLASIQEGSEEGAAPPRSASTSTKSTAKTTTRSAAKPRTAARKKS